MKYEGLLQLSPAKPHTWLDFMAGGGGGMGGPVGQTLTAGDSGISFCQMFPLIPIYQHFAQLQRFSKTGALLVRLKGFQCQANLM